MTQRLTRAQAAGAVLTLLCGVIAAAGWVVSSNGTIADVVEGRLDGIDRRLEQLERHRAEDHALLVRLTRDVAGIVSYLRGRGGLPQVARVSPPPCEVR